MLRQLERLRQDGNRNKYPASTHHRAPYKPFLLLSVLDVAELDKLASPFLSLDDHVVSLLLKTFFNDYCGSLRLGSTPSKLHLPFFHLESDSIWKLVPRADARTSRPASVCQLQERFCGADLSPDLFSRLQSPEKRTRLRDILTGASYFTPEAARTIREQSRINIGSERYADQLIRAPVRAPSVVREDAAPFAPIRDAGFRKAIRRIYDNRCALCGLRILTPDNHAVVQAAHIIPWATSHDDSIENGICLCPTCHWAFDQGLVSIDPEDRILVSQSLWNAPNAAGHLLQLENRPIVNPADKQHRPNAANLEAHRKAHGFRCR